jgi:hypothetical protein
VPPALELPHQLIPGETQMYALGIAPSEHEDETYPQASARPAPAALVVSTQMVPEGQHTAEPTEGSRELHV